MLDIEVRVARKANTRVLASNMEQGKSIMIVSHIRLKYNRSINLDLSEQNAKAICGIFVSFYMFVPSIGNN